VQRDDDCDLELDDAERCCGAAPPGSWYEWNAGVLVLPRSLKSEAAAEFGLQLQGELSLLEDDLVRLSNEW